MASKIKKGDKVIVLAGKDRGAEGEVVQVMPSDNRVIVRGVNLIKKHQKQTQTEQSGRHYLARGANPCFKYCASRSVDRQADARRVQD